MRAAPSPVAARHDAGRGVSDWLLRHRAPARRLLGANLLILALAVAVTAGI